MKTQMNLSSLALFGKQSSVIPFNRAKPIAARKNIVSRPSSREPRCVLLSRTFVWSDEKVPWVSAPQKKFALQKDNTMAKYIAVAAFDEYKQRLSSHCGSGHGHLTSNRIDCCRMDGLFLVGFREQDRRDQEIPNRATMVLLKNRRGRSNSQLNPNAINIQNAPRPPNSAAISGVIAV